jgi:hypothetical protein
MTTFCAVRDETNREIGVPPVVEFQRSGAGYSRLVLWHRILLHDKSDSVLVTTESTTRGKKVLAYDGIVQGWNILWQTSYSTKFNQPLMKERNNPPNSTLNTTRYPDLHT